jgi:zinc protease
MAQEGPFQVGLQTQKQQTNEALAVVNEVLSNYLKDGPTAKEIQAAKDNLIGGFALRIDNNRKILSHIAAIGYYGLPLDYLDTWTDKVAKVSATDVLRAFNRQLDMGRMTTVVVGAEK